MSTEMFHHMKKSMQKQWDELQQKLFQAWEKHLAPTYHALEQREQQIVTMAAILLPIIIFIFGILLPAADKNKQLRADIKAFGSQLGEAQQLASQLASQPKNQSAEHSSRNNLLTQVDNIARQTGVRTFMTRLRPQQVMGKKARLQAQMKNAPYDKVVSFLTSLAKHKLPLQQLKIQASSPGLVHVQAVIGG